MASPSRGRAESASEVLLYVYDLSNGMVKALSPALIGKELSGLWHTGIVLRGTEYYFGCLGVDSSPAGKTGLGDPHRVVSLGHTELPHDVCVEYIRDLARYSYRRSSYDLFRHNCNHFSEDLSLFLTGNSIPMDIRELPDDFLSTPMGNMMHSFQHMSDEALKVLEQHSVHEQQRNPQSPRPPQ